MALLPGEKKILILRRKNIFIQIVACEEVVALQCSSKGKKKYQNLKYPASKKFETVCCDREKFVIIAFMDTDLVEFQGK